MASRGIHLPTLRCRRICACVAALLALWLPIPQVGAQSDSGALAARHVSAEEILQRADEVRFPKEGFEVGVTIDTAGGGQVETQRSYKVLSKGNENALVLTVAPASDRGQILLMKGFDLWLFLPRVSQPVRLSPAQRLVGQVSYGDIARANFTGDYSPKLVGSDVVGGQRLYVLELTAVSRRVTYQRVRYWVGQSNYWPYKAEFYSISGRLLKTCRYEDFRTLGGRTRPTKLVMTDALRSGETSTMQYADMKARDLPDRIFTKDYLKRLQ